MDLTQIPACPACGSAHVGRYCPGTYSPASDPAKHAANDIDVANWRAGGPLVQGGGANVVYANPVDATPQNASPAVVPAPVVQAPAIQAPAIQAPVPVVDLPQALVTPPRSSVPAWRGEATFDLDEVEVVHPRDGGIRLIGYVDGRMTLFLRVGKLVQ